MVVNGGRPLKRAKRRITAGLHDFLSFPSPALVGDGIPDGPFRSRVGALLTRHARLSPPPLDLIFSPAPAPALATWRISFRVGGEELGRIVEMDVIEEEVLRSRSVYCDHCRVVGWSGHPVCRKRYHFIIRNNTNPLSGYHQMCTRCGSLLHMLDSRCISCNYEMTAEDVEDWAYRQLEDTSHLLHGVVHANGYGHLLRVNGREGGSKYLTGSEIMGFWDRLCKMLHVRKVTVMDISKKYGMEYRLLHAVTAGHPWYGDWGYRFGSGSFALTAGAYANAVDTLANTPLSIFFSHSRSPRTNLQGTIAFYRSLADCKLETVRDLFRFIMHMLQSSHERSPLKTHLKKKLDDITSSGILCAWAKHDVEKAEDSMVKVLRAVGGRRWVTWHALRGATCRAVASPELLDYCLKGLGGKVTCDGMHVVVRCNPDNNSIEYRLEAASNQLLSPVVKDPAMPSAEDPAMPSAEHLLRDLKFLYEALLNPTTMHAYKPQGMRKSACGSAVKLLDCKQFVKRYDNGIGNHESDDSVKMTTPANPFSFSVWCHVELVNQPKDYKAPPPELIVLPTTATLAELKIQATKAFQETYIIFQNFQGEQLVGFEKVEDDNANLRQLLGEKGNVVKVRGRWFGDDECKLGQFKMERGLESWIVDCACGAKDDDGERMLACDLCGVWQHTRCSGISDLEKVPVKFVCRKCLAANKAKAGAGGRNGSNGRCKDEVSSSSSIADVAGCGWMATVG